MSTYGNERSTLSRIITWFLVAILAIAALKLAFWSIGMMVGIGSFFLFTIGPVVLIGWLVMKAYRFLTRSASDPTL